LDMCSGSCVGGFSEPTRGLKSIVYNKTRFLLYKATTLHQSSELPDNRPKTY